MKWTEIKRRYPDKFILIGDVEEERVACNKYRIIGGSVIKISNDPEEIFRAYRFHKEKGEDVLYSLPATPMDFIVENEIQLSPII